MSFGTSTFFPLGSNAAAGTDPVIQKPYPGLEFNPTETYGLYQEIREIAGTLYIATNAQYNAAYAQWYQVKTSVASYALAIGSTGIISNYTAAATGGTGLTAITFVPTVSTFSGALTAASLAVTGAGAATFNAGITMGGALTGATTGAFSGTVSVGGIATTQGNSQAVSFSGVPAYGFQMFTASAIDGSGNPVMRLLNSAGSAAYFTLSARGDVTNSGTLLSVGNITTQSSITAYSAATAGVLYLGSDGAGSLSRSGAATTPSYTLNGGSSSTNLYLGAMLLSDVVGTGTTLAASTVGGTVYLKNGAGAAYAPVSGGAYTNASDRAFKDNVVPVSGGLETVMQLAPCSFDWLDSGQSDIGFIAQDVDKIVPAIVRTDQDGGKGIVYTGITALNTAAIIEIATKLRAAGIAGF